MKRIKIGELKKHIRFFDGANIPLMVYGTYGIGKSQIVRESAIEKSEERSSRIFLNWMSATNEEKKSAIENPEKYFAFIDIRLSQLEPSDIRGIPNIFNTDESREYYQKLISDEKNKPLINRAVNAVYPPASTFKIIMSTAMLQENAFPLAKKLNVKEKLFMEEEPLIVISMNLDTVG